MKYYIKLLRIKHYIKNILLFVPLFFAGKIFEKDRLVSTCIGFICFCLISSAIYILNDYKDMENDRKHPVKKFRPLASGEIRPYQAIAVVVCCLAISFLLSIKVGNIHANICLGTYFMLNVAYSFGGLKKKPIIDVVILASGFVLRVFYGGFLTGIIISKWLYLVIASGSLYMGLGKRRNELKRQTDTRDVLKYYTVPFLDKNMYVCVALANVFYALWTLDMGNKKLIWTVPVFTIIMMYYSLDTEGDSDGDPVEVILHDKILMWIILAYAVCIFGLLYL